MSFKMSTVGINATRREQIEKRGSVYEQYRYSYKGIEVNDRSTHTTIHACPSHIVLPTKI